MAEPWKPLHRLFDEAGVKGGDFAVTHRLKLLIAERDELKKRNEFIEQIVVQARQFIDRSQKLLRENVELRDNFRLLSKDNDKLRRILMNVQIALEKF